jgi:chemotaxis protein MotC
VKTYARNYLQRYEQSPYSEDFFRQLVDAVLALKGKISESEIEEIASFAWPGAQLPFYLRIARGSIVSGDLSRARFASQKAVALAIALKADETQAQLYLAVSNVGSDKTGEAERILSSLSKDRLHNRDVKLLEAATTMADKILAQPAAIPILGLPKKFLTKSKEPSPRRAPPAAQKEATPVVVDDAMVTQAREKLDAIDAMLGKAKK